MSTKHQDRPTTKLVQLRTRKTSGEQASALKRPTAGRAESGFVYRLRVPQPCVRVTGLLPLDPSARSRSDYGSTVISAATRLCLFVSS
jgi:hypothetical protein